MAIETRHRTSHRVLPRPVRAPACPSHGGDKLPPQPPDEDNHQGWNDENYGEETEFLKRIYALGQTVIGALTLWKGLDLMQVAISPDDPTMHGLTAVRALTAAAVAVELIPYFPRQSK